MCGWIRCDVFVVVIETTKVASGKKGGAAPAHGGSHSHGQCLHACPGSCMITAVLLPLPHSVQWSANR